MSPTGRDEGRGDLGEGGAGDGERSHEKEAGTCTVGTQVGGKRVLVKKMR